MTKTSGLGLLLFALLVLSATAGAESVAELALPGEPVLPLDAHTLAIGGAGDARWGLESGLPDQPAQLLALDGVTFSTVIQLRRARRDLDGVTWDETRQDFPAFQVSARLPWGLALGAGYRAALRSRGSFQLDRSVTLFDEGGAVIDEIDYRLDFEQSGGINRFPLSLAYAAGENLRLGLGLTLYRGNLEQEWVYDFPNDPFGDADFEYQDRRVRRLGEWRGSALQLGVQARLREGIGASLSWEGASSLSGEQRIETAGETDVLLSALEGESPARWAAGVAVQLSPTLVVSGQWNREAWAEYDAPVADHELFDVDRFGLGLEWTRRTERQDRRRRQLFPLRLGFRLANLPRPDPVSGKKVEEQLLALGTGIDVQEGRGSIDLTLYWQRFNVDDGEVENRWGLALGLRTSEIWKRRAQPN